jgi:hypothetical protein
MNRLFPMSPSVREPGREIFCAQKNSTLANLNPVKASSFLRALNCFKRCFNAKTTAKNGTVAAEESLPLLSKRSSERYTIHHTGSQPLKNHYIEKSPNLPSVWISVRSLTNWQIATSTNYYSPYSGISSAKR